MAKSNGGIIGPDNIPTGPLGTASGVWRLQDAFKYQGEGLWPVATGITYPVANSLRFNSGSSDNLSRTPASTTNRRTFTLSTWVKKTTINTADMVLACGTYLSTSLFQIYFENDKFIVTQETSGGSIQSNITTTQLFRDVSAWYHLVVAVDTTQSTESNRVKIYLNGSQITSFSTETYPSQNLDYAINTSSIPNVFGTRNSASLFFDGYMSEVCFIDGQALTPSSFGETDTISGNWKPKDVSGLTFGTNGFYLNFQNSGALGTDSSGNGNNFTVNNLTSVDQSTDTPTNNFATADPLHFNVTIPSAGTLSDGNLTFTSSQGASAYPAFYSTMAVSQGKWYAEFKVTTANSAIIGIGSGIPSGGFFGGGLYDYGYYYNGTFYNNGGNTGSQSSYTDGDIISVAMDLDNNKVYVAKNNTWQHSGDPSAGTGGYTITAPSSTDTGVYHIVYGDVGGGTPAIQGNFGSPPYAANGYTDSNGFGDFSYAVPTGYYALNTQNINVQG